MRPAQPLRGLAPRVTDLILFGLLAVLALFCFLANLFSSTRLYAEYEVMREASELASEAMGAIKEYRLESGMGLSGYDTLETGMIGDGALTSITTTDGNVQAKRTSCDANWSAVIVSMFVRAGLKEGDQAAMVFSGSFPAMNICAMAAAQAYGLDVCLMASVGASVYGATDPDFTFFDMAEYLCDEGILTHRLDYVSFGGNDDIGDDFEDEEDIFAGTRTAEEIRASIRSRVEASESTVFIYEPDFGANIDLRLAYLSESVPDIGFLLNVGGSQVGLGTGSAAYISSGYSAPSRFGFLRSDSLGARNANYGLLQYFHSVGIPVASMLNIKSLASEYGIAYDPDEVQPVGEGDAYYTTDYGLAIPLAACLVAAACLVVFFFVRRKERRAPESRCLIGRKPGTWLWDGG